MSSLPRLTFLPATNLVPLCRTIILPALADWPPKSLIPRYLGRESLPNFVAPAAFVFAIMVILKLTKIKEFVKAYQADIILVIGVILISLLSFAIGYITAKEQGKEPIRFEEGVGGLDL